MEIKDHHHLLLLQPLTSTGTTTISEYHSDHTTSNSNIVYRYILFFFIVIIAIWANYQASQGFEIIIVNDVNNSPAGCKFHLFFVSNDKATQMVLSASKLAEEVLYPDEGQQKKPIRSVTFKLTNKNLTEEMTVSGDHNYVVHVSSSVMEESNVEKAWMLAVQRGMTRVWLWTGEDGAPKELIDGIVEYVNLVAGGWPMLDYLSKSETEDICWKHWEQMGVVKFLRYCEKMRNGFIGRLNQAMKSRWHDQMVDEALGVPVQELCRSYYVGTSTASI